MKIIKKPIKIVDINFHGCKPGGTGGNACQSKRSS